MTGPNRQAYISNDPGNMTALDSEGGHLYPNLLFPSGPPAADCVGRIRCNGNAHLPSFSSDVMIDTSFSKGV